MALTPHSTSESAGRSNEGTQGMATENEIEIARTREQKYRRKRSKDFYFPRDIILSKAWRTLADNRAATAMFVYMIFRNKMVMKPITGARAKSKGKGSYYCENVDSIQFTYREALRKYGLTFPRFKRAIDWLVKVGLIDIIQQGSGLYREISLYGISERWRDYGKPEFRVQKRKKRIVHYGFTKAKSKQTQHTPALAIQHTPALAMKKEEI